MIGRAWYVLLKLWTGNDYARVVPKAQSVFSRSEVPPVVVPIRFDEFMQPFTTVAGNIAYEKDFRNGKFEPITY